LKFLHLFGCDEYFGLLHILTQSAKQSADTQTQGKELEMATEKTFTVAGVTTKDGVCKVRFANDIEGRSDLLIKGGHTDVVFVELGAELTKTEAVAAIKDRPEFAGAEAQAAIKLFMIKNGMVETVKRPRGRPRKVKAEVVAETAAEPEVAVQAEVKAEAKVEETVAEPKRAMRDPVTGRFLKRVAEAA
jgi:hypothetical protein